jgi:hypothetical protein
MARKSLHSAAVSALALFIACILTSFCAAQTGLSYISSVPDWNQPPLSGSTNYCAPVSALNILDYYGSLPSNPITGLVDPGDAVRYPANSNTADLIGYFMGTNGAGSPARIHNPGYQMPGTHMADQDTGLAEYIAWNTAGQFHPADPTPPGWKTGYNNAMVTGLSGSASSLWGAYTGEIDASRPVKVDFNFWNPIYTNTFFIDPATQDTFYVYQWGPNTGGSGGQNPQEQWSPDVGHAVTGVGYIPNWNGSNWGVVHDNWPSTHANVVIPWQNLMEIVMVDFTGPSLPDPVVYLRFNEGTGTVAYDETSNNNDGTISGPSWINRSSGKALYFHGGGQWFNGDCVTVPHSSSLVIGNSFTVEAWIDSVGSDHYGAIVDKHRRVGSADEGFTLYICGGKPRFSLYRPGVSKNIYGTTNVRGNRAHHIAGTWDGDSLRIYVNAKLENTVGWANSMASSAANLGIGKRLSGWGGYLPFPGVIDEVKLYTRALSQSEIKSDFYDCFIVGDANGDGVVNVADVIFLINFIFRNGPAPDPMESGDANGDGTVNIADAVYLIAYIFFGGPPPVQPSSSNIDNGHSSILKANLPVLTTSFDGEKTTFEIESVADLYGVQLAIECDADATISNLIEGTQLHKGQSNNHARIGILDLEGIGHVSAGQTSIIEISGHVRLISAIGADQQGRAVEMIIDPATKTLTMPDMFALKQNHPNPFNPTTTINFAIPNASEVSLEVYNVTGQRVVTLTEGYLEAGEHMVEWNGRDSNGQSASSGIYFYRIKAGEFSATRKMILLK